MTENHGVPGSIPGLATILDPDWLCAVSGFFVLDLGATDTVAFARFSLLSPNLRQNAVSQHKKNP